MDVIITTAGLGTRLGEITEHFNKALIKVGDKAVLSHLIEFHLKRDTNQRFVIATGYKHKDIVEYLYHAYSDIKKQFKFCYAENYKTGSLLSTLLQCKPHVDGDFIFHACDTFIDNNYKFPEILTENTVFVSKSDNPELYTKISINHNKHNFHGKEETNPLYYDYIGLCYIKEYSKFWKIAENLELTPETSDVDVLRKLKFNIEYVSNSLWYDTGDLDNLLQCQDKYKSEYNILSKVNESIYFVNGLVLKYFSDSTKVKQRIARVEPGTVLNKITPELLNTTTRFYFYKKIPGNTLAVTHNKNRTWEFLDWCKEYLWDINNTNAIYRDQTFHFYINKTLRRIELYLNGNHDEEVYVNGGLIPTVYEIIKTISRFQILFNTNKSPYHGDLVMSNVIDTGDNFLLIDWRESFCEDDIHVGDIYYDLAKYVHSHYMNHYVLNNSFFTFVKTIFNNKKYYEIELPMYPKTQQSLNAVKEWCEANKLSWVKIQLIVGLIWINMAPLHEDNIKELLFLYGKYQIQKTIIEINE